MLCYTRPQAKYKYSKFGEVMTTPITKTSFFFKYIRVLYMVN